MGDQDRMPGRNTPEFAIYANRLTRLSSEDFYTLFGVVGITFASRRSLGHAATLEEIKTIPRDMIVEVFDEADSREKIDRFLQERGL